MQSQSPISNRMGASVFCLLLMAMSSLTSQVLAQRFMFHPLLGRPWFGQFYAPWAWFIWLWRFYDQAEQTFLATTFLFSLGLGSLFLGYALIFRRQNKNNGIPGLYGTAHWADETEIRQTGLLEGEGVFVGGWKDGRGVRYLRHNGPEHIAAIAPTRSGKGVGLVVPTLLSWPHSVVVNDMKGELWALTAGWRHRDAGNIVLKFDPTSETGNCRFNPLEEVRLGTQKEIADVQNLVNMLVDPHGKGLNDHWAKTAHAFLTGVVLHRLYQAKARGRVTNLSDVARVLSDPEKPIDTLYQEMLENQHASEQGRLLVAMAARDMINRPDRERGSILSTSISFLTLYRDPLVAQNTEVSDFKVHDLMNQDKPVSLYLVVKPSDKDRLKPLMRLVINQIVRGLTQEDITFEDGKQRSPHRHRMLLMLDEFPSLGKLDILQEALAYIAGYGIKAYLIMQDISQLWHAYGREESILSNCHIRLAYAPNKIETADWLSRLTGNSTVIKEQISTSRQTGAFFKKNISTSFQEVARPLLTPDEVMRLPGLIKDAHGRIMEPGEMLIYVAGYAPIRGSQTPYFMDPVLMARSLIPAPSKRKPLELAL
jgi:type IV secretion system protein VirD4